MATKKRGFLKYKSYSFVEKDPIIDALRTAVSASKKKYSTLHADSGVSTSTIHNWFHGRTRRPQFATVAAVARALGKTTITFASNSGNPRLSD
jgi:hypothetical protein